MRVRRRFGSRRGLKRRVTNVTDFRVLRPRGRGLDSAGYNLARISPILPEERKQILPDLELPAVTRRFAIGGLAPIKYPSTLSAIFTFLSQLHPPHSKI